MSITIPFPRIFTLVLAFVSGINAAPVATPTASVLPYFHNLAVANGKLYFGSATDQPYSGEYTDTRYQTVLNDTRIFGALTPINSMKGQYTHPQVSVFNYTDADVTANLARSTGKYLRCHNLIWYKRQPAWLTDGSTNWTRTTLLPQMQNHIKTMITHYADICHAWDVANEVFNDDGTLAASPWYSVIGSDYVELAFKYAYDAATATGKDIKLYYNDFWIEAPGPRINAVYAMIKSIKAKYNFTISVGLESHFKVNDIYTKANQTAVMSTLQSLNATFAVTELDVRFPSLPPNGSYTYQAQALRYWETVSACMSFSNCEGITVWDFLDTYSWVPSSFPGAGQANLLFANYTQKLAAQAVVDALQGKACSVC